MISAKDAIMDIGALTLAMRINTAASAVRTITANGLATRDSVENDKSDKERNRENGKLTQATGVKDRLVSFHNSLHASNIHTEGVIVNGRV